MHMIAGVLQYVAVASFAEAWIENSWEFLAELSSPSPPSRRRGLKKKWILRYLGHDTVASFAEAWIEK